MSNLTLNTLNTIAQPVNTYLPAPIDADLASFARTVNTLAENGKLDVLVAAFAANEPAPAPAQEAKPAMRRTKSGGMMTTEAGTITNGQFDRILAECERIGDPMTKAEVAIMCDWSMAYASDYYFDLTA